MKKQKNQGNKVIRQIHKTDGFILFDCGTGACPEIKHVGDEYIIRSSRNSESKIIFTKDELSTLKSAIELYV